MRNLYTLAKAALAPTEPFIFQLYQFTNISIFYMATCFGQPLEHFTGRARARQVKPFRGHVFIFMRSIVSLRLKTCERVHELRRKSH